MKITYPTPMRASVTTTPATSPIATDGRVLAARGDVCVLGVRDVAGRRERVAATRATGHIGFAHRTGSLTWSPPS